MSEEIPLKQLLQEKSVMLKIYPELVVLVFDAFREYIEKKPTINVHMNDGHGTVKHTIDKDKLLEELE